MNNLPLGSCDMNAEIVSLHVNNARYLIAELTVQSFKPRRQYLSKMHFGKKIPRQINVGMLELTEIHLKVILSLAL